jgi:hypothetical protein
VTGSSPDVGSSRKNIRTMIEGSTLVVFPEHGHISMITEIPQISTDLADAV